MKIHINDLVKIKLTDRGRAIHRSRYREILHKANIEYSGPKEDKDGYSVWPLWQIMEVFGYYFQLTAANLPFDPNMELIEKKDENSSTVDATRAFFHG